MRTRLALLLVVVMLGLPVLPAAADNGPTPPPSGDSAPGTPAPTPSESPTPTPTPTPDPSESEEPSETPSDEQSTNTEPAPRPERRMQSEPTQPPNSRAAVVRVTASTVGVTGAGVNTNVWGTASGAPGREVWTEVKVGSSWSRSQTGRTSTTGGYSLPLTYGKNSGGTVTYRVAVRSASGIVRSPEVKLTRVAFTTNTAGTTRVGAGANVWGTAIGGPNTTIWTEVRLPNGSWSRSQSGRTSSSGSYALPLTYGQNTPGYHVFRVGVLTNTGNAYSAPFGLTRVSVSAYTSGRATVGTGTNVWGTAQAAPNSPVRVEVRLSNGSWSTSQIGRTNSTGYYALPLTYGSNTAGTYTFRVVVTRNGVNIYSPTVSLTRVPRTPTVSLDPRCMSGRVMCASKKDRKLYWVINGQVQKTMDARFGCPAYPSDNGSFRVGWKSYNHTSTIYGSWMPRAMFYNGGEAVHYSQDFASRGYAGCSHGCVNIRDWNGINWLYDQVRVGDKVIVY